MKEKVQVSWLPGINWKHFPAVGDCAFLKQPGRLTGLHVVVLHCWVWLRPLLCQVNFLVKGLWMWVTLDMCPSSFLAYRMYCMRVTSDPGVCVCVKTRQVQLWAGNVLLRIGALDSPQRHSHALSTPISGDLLLTPLYFSAKNNRIHFLKMSKN